MDDYVQVVSMLKVMSEDMESMANDAKAVYDQAVEIRKRSEEIEALVGECLKLIDT